MRSPSGPRSGPLCLPALARGRSVTRAEATGVLRNLGDAVLARALTAATRAARCERGWHRWLGPRTHRGEVSALGDPRLQVPQLAFQVGLQPASVLALERAQVIDPALKFLTGLDQRAYGLTVPLLRPGPCCPRPGTPPR
jgi:hypothetical protein